MGVGYPTLGIDHVGGVMLDEFLERESSRLCADVANRNVSFIAQILAFAAKNNHILHDPAPNVAHTVETPDDIDDDEDDGIRGWPCPTPDDARLIITYLTCPLGV